MTLIDSAQRRATQRLVEREGAVGLQDSLAAVVERALADEDAWSTRG